MPGIVGLIHRDGATVSITEPIKKLMHFPTYCSQEINVGNGIQLGQVWRHENLRHGEWHYEEGSKSGVLLNGSMMLSAPRPHRVTPQKILEFYHQKGFSQWQNFDGAFIAVIVDLKQRKILIANDRLGTLPLYYSQMNDMFCFGPEVKAVMTALKQMPKFSRAGLISFLAAGYCLGDTTLFESIQFLKPGSLLTLNLETFNLERTLLWNLQYEPSSELQSRRTAGEALYEAIKEANKLVLCDNPQRFDLFLSGGLDSRGILGVLDKLGQLPTRALSWGLREDLPYSDARIAHLMADEFHVPFTFKSYTSDGILQNAETWCYLSELANDNFGWYAEGTGMLSDLFDVTRAFSLKGDECWGWGGWCHTEREARSLVLLNSLPPALHSMLRQDQVAEFELLYDQEVRALTQFGTFQNWNDFKDYLYVYGRVTRFIFSMGYYKELATELRRPFLANGVLEVVRRLPAKFRVHKNLYVDVLKHHLPRTMFLPNKMVNSLPDWPYDVRTNPVLRQYFLGLCNVQSIESGVLGELIDCQLFTKVLDRLFGGEVRPIRRTTSLFERTQHAWWPVISQSQLWGELKRLRPQQVPTPSFNAFPVLIRIALIVLLEKKLAGFAP